MRHWIGMLAMALSACGTSPPSPGALKTNTSASVIPEPKSPPNSPFVRTWSETESDRTGSGTPASQLYGSSAEARAYTLSVLEPLFDKYVNKRTQDDDPIGLSERVRKAYALIKAGKISIQFSEASLPKIEGALFTSGFDPVNNRPSITAHAQHLREREKAERPDIFKDVLAVSIAHELIHFEVCTHPLGYRHTSAEVQTEEAKTWGITIIEIIRPLAAKQRVPYRNMLSASDALAKLSDDYASPAWVGGFAEMVDATGQTR